MDEGPLDSLKNRKYPAILFYLLMIVVAFLVGIIVFNYIIMPSLVGKRDTAIVPAIEGMSLKQALEVCGKDRLELSVMGHRNSDEIPEGYIMAQDPRRGQVLKRGRRIGVIVSSGRRMEIVPSFAGKTLRETEVLVESSGLARGRTVRLFTPGEGQPSVLATSPSTGSRVPRGTPVDILVAMRGEPRAFLMPNLVGRDFPFVKDKLEKLGFKVIRVPSKHEEKGFPNTILSQLPAAGAKIKEGDTIELAVSTLE